MGRHETAIKRYIAIIMSIPIALSGGAYLWVNPITRTWISTYTPWLQTINFFYFFIFLIAGLIALLFELPFTRPDLMTSTGAGKFGTLIVAIVGAGCLLIAGLIFFGLYNITTDTGIYNTIIGYVLMPAFMIMFALEIYVVLGKNKRFALHGGLT